MKPFTVKSYEARTLNMGWDRSSSRYCKGNNEVAGEDAFYGLGVSLSLDLNPIENLWRELKLQVYKQETEKLERFRAFLERRVGQKAPWAVCKPSDQKQGWPNYSYRSHNPAGFSVIPGRQWLLVGNLGLVLIMLTHHTACVLTYLPNVINCCPKGSQFKVS